ncbi:methyltransferase [Bacteriovoracaceae bacterium]|nr:methyltransferase [Bacteriovoracaceae bacterium]
MKLKKKLMTVLEEITGVGKLENLSTNTLLNFTPPIKCNKSKFTKTFFSNTANSNPYELSQKIDRDFDYKIFKIESKLLRKYRAFYKVEDDSNRKKHFPSCQAWIGLHHFTLQTPYSLIHDALMHLKDISVNRIIDVGAGYGRVGLVVDAFFPNAEFIGYEVVKERVNEGNRVFDKHDMNNCSLIKANVLSADFDLPQAEIYFIYDFGEKEDIHQLLLSLAHIAKSNKTYLIANGEYVNELLKGMNSLWKKSSFDSEKGEMKIYFSNEA